MIATHQPILTKDFRSFIPDRPSVITEASWIERDRLAGKHYPQIMDLLAFPEGRLIDILIDVEQGERPQQWRPVGVPGDSRPLAMLPSRSWLEWSLFRGVAPDARRPSISPALRARVIDRDGLVCGICQGAVDPDDVHLDHVQPFSKGGPTTFANLRVTHSLCNIRRGNRG